MPEASQTLYPNLIFGTDQAGGFVFNAPGGSPVVAAIHTDNVGHIEVVIPAGVPLGIDLQWINGNPVIESAGEAGLLAVGGSVADGAAATGGPVQIGAVTDQIPVAVADSLLVHLITDLERYLRVVAKSYDTLAAADRGMVNTIADDRDESAQTWANTTNTAMGTSYYPSAAGYLLGNRDHLTLQLVMTDNTTTVEASLDGITWLNVTLFCISMTTGAAAASYATGAGASANFMVDCNNFNTVYVRCAVVYPDNSNATQIKAFTRKA